MFSISLQEYTREEDTAEMYAKAKAEIELEEKGASGNSQKGHVTRTTQNVPDGHNGKPVPVYVRNFAHYCPRILF